MKIFKNISIILGRVNLFLYIINITYQVGYYVQRCNETDYLHIDNILFHSVTRTGRLWEY